MSTDATPTSALAPHIGPPHVTPRTPEGLRARLLALDSRAFDAVAARHWPGGDRLLPRLSRSANHGLLWFGTAAAMAAAGPRARRAAAHGVASLALASAAINTLGKRSVRRPRPLLDAVPLIRQLKRQPITTSFPSGHSASAAAFATGVALESGAWGAAVAPVAGAVALSRVYTGVHFPGDVLVGAALGAGAAFAVRGLAASRRPRTRTPGRTPADAPALPGGDGLVVVAEDGAGERTGSLREALPLAEFVVCDATELPAELEKAADRARAIGVCGDDTAVNVAAAVALRHALPLAVLPGGASERFAYEIGVEEALDVCRAVESGSAVAVAAERLRMGGTETDVEGGGGVLTVYRPGADPTR